MFKAKNAEKFLDDLIPLTFAAIRSKLGNVNFERAEDPGLTFQMSLDGAKSKGGRLLTVEEATEYLVGVALFPKEDQWVAVHNDEGEPEWIQMGDKYPTPGKCHKRDFGDAPTWGDDHEDRTWGKPTWQRILLWKVDENQEELESVQKRVDD